MLEASFLENELFISFNMSISPNFGIPNIVSHSKYIVIHEKFSRKSFSANYRPLLIISILISDNPGDYKKPFFEC
jgi:hypothetical protein